MSLYFFWTDSQSTLVAVLLTLYSFVTVKSSSTSLLFHENIDGAMFFVAMTKQNGGRKRSLYSFPNPIDEVQGPQNEISVT